MEMKLDCYLDKIIRKSIIDLSKSSQEIEGENFNEYYSLSWGKRRK